MKKRVFSALLCLVMVIGLLPGIALADHKRGLNLHVGQMVQVLPLTIIVWTGRLVDAPGDRPGYRGAAGMVVDILNVWWEHHLVIGVDFYRQIGPPHKGPRLVGGIEHPYMCLNICPILWNCD